MIEKHRAAEENVKTMLKNLSLQDFKDFGLKQIAYIRTVQGNDNNIIYSIHSADGKQLYAAETLNQAIAATRQNELEPVTVH